MGMTEKIIMNLTEEEIELEAEEGLQGKYDDFERYRNKQGWDRRFDDDYYIGFIHGVKWVKSIIERR